MICLRNETTWYYLFWCDLYPKTCKYTFSKGLCVNLSYFFWNGFVQIAVDFKLNNTSPMDKKDRRGGGQMEEGKHIMNVSPIIARLLHHHYCTLCPSFALQPYGSRRGEGGHQPSPPFPTSLGSELLPDHCISGGGEGSDWAWNRHRPFSDRVCCLEKITSGGEAWSGFHR